MSKQTKQAIEKAKRRTGSELTLIEHAETDEIEIRKAATAKRPAKRIRFPRERFKRFRQNPKEFKRTQAALNEWNARQRELSVYATSIESRVGYSSLFRVMKGFLSELVVYYRSKQGGALSFEEAIEKVYGAEVVDEEYLKELFDRVTTKPIDYISFSDLWGLARDSPATAENVWEWIKEEAIGEMMSGHLAARVLEPVGLREAWTRAKYIAVRESFCLEYKPTGGIELSMIDLLAQSWFMVQFWTEELSTRMTGEPCRLPQAYLEERQRHKRAYPREYEEDKRFWEIPTISESEAIEQAAAMVDRFQKMFFRTLRQLRDWRRYAPAPLTINNPQQVNIGEQVNVATDGGQQVNLKNDENKS